MKGWAILAIENVKTGITLMESKRSPELGNTMDDSPKDEKDT